MKIITITGSLYNTLINGNAGNDTLIINSTNIASSTLYGGQGNDIINASGDAIYINGGKGNDDIDTTGDKEHTIYGGDGEDSINSDSTKKLFIDGGAMKDIITVTGISNTFHSIDGGAGDDIITATTGEELIDGGSEDGGNDTIDSAGGDDTIYGRAGNDLIKLTADGTTRVQGGAGDDVIEVYLEHLTHVDTIKGERGTDTIAIVGNSIDHNMWDNGTPSEKSFDSISTVETLAFGTPNTEYTIAGTKAVYLSSKVQSAGILTIDASNASGLASDVLVVNASRFSSSSNLTFIGSDDKDVNVNFTGGSGNDTITTGKTTEDGGDTLTGSFGEDTFNIVATSMDAEITDLGKGGSDTLIVSNVARGVNAAVTSNYKATKSTANNKSNADVVLNAADGINVDMVSAAGRFGYVINGGASASTLQGSNFNDSITGNAGSDKLIGNRGSDTIEGGLGADIMNAGKGNGYIKDAGNGNDIITHDIGSSLVIQNTGSDTVILKALRAGVYVVAAAGGVRNINASTSTGSLTLDGSGAGENIVRYEGGFGDDTIKGSLASDVLIGNDGNDIITGGLSTDTIIVGDGANSVVFTSGITADQISGYTSDDIVLRPL